MPIKENNLHAEIEKARKKLKDLVDNKFCINKEVQKQSQYLDKLLNLYYKNITHTF